MLCRSPYTLVLVLAALPSPVALAQDTLRSHACAQRLDTLQAARAAGRGASAERIELLRRHATLACLGGAGAARRPSPTVQQPLAVPPPTLEPPPATRQPTHTPPPPPVAPIDRRPAVITFCDGGGCWDSNGTRLNRAGPVLLGPGGPCTTVGTTVRCP